MNFVHQPSSKILPSYSTLLFSHGTDNQIAELFLDHMGDDSGASHTYCCIVIRVISSLIVDQRKRTDWPDHDFLNQLLRIQTLTDVETVMNRVNPPENHHQNQARYHLEKIGNDLNDDPHPFTVIKRFQLGVQRFNDQFLTPFLGTEQSIKES